MNNDGFANAILPIQASRQRPLETTASIKDWMDSRIFIQGRRNQPLEHVGGGSSPVLGCA